MVDNVVGFFGNAYLELHSYNNHNSFKVWTNLTKINNEIINDAKTSVRFYNDTMSIEEVWEQE